MESALKRLEGVSMAKVNLAERKVTVEFDQDKVSLEQMKAAIEDAGYDVP